MKYTNAGRHFRLAANMSLSKRYERSFHLLVETFRNERLYPAYQSRLDKELISPAAANVSWYSSSLQWRRGLWPPATVLNWTEVNIRYKCGYCVILGRCYIFLQYSSDRNRCWITFSVYRRLQRLGKILFNCREDPNCIMKFYCHELRSI